MEDNPISNNAFWTIINNWLFAFSHLIKKINSQTTLYASGQESFHKEKKEILNIRVNAQIMSDIIIYTVNQK